MASIEFIKASDGSGNANVATVQNTRSALASTIIVDTVAGINTAGFSGSMGTPHTFTDPITSETITVISEATAVDFTGHIDGSNIEIDTIAPGYTDLGSAVGDIVIIRPTTQWGDNVAEVLEVAHDDDGTLKAGAVDNAAVLASDVVTTAKILDSNVTTAKIADSNVTTRKIASNFDVAYYATGSQAIAATYTACTLGTSETAPSLILATQSLVAVTLSGAFFTSTLSAYIKWYARLSTDNVTFVDASTAQQMLQSTNSLVEHTGFGHNTSERSGNPSFTRYYKLAAGTWYFQPGHIAGGAVGNMSYGLTLSVNAIGSI